MTTFAEETGVPLLEMLLTNNFSRIWLWFEDSHGGQLFCFGLIRINSWFITFDDLISLSKDRDRISPTFFCTNWHDSFFDRLSNCVGSNANIWFVRPSVISNVCRWEKSVRMALSHDDLALSVHARHQCSVAQRLFLDELHGLRLWAIVGHDWIHYTRFSQCYGMVFIALKRF